MTGEVVISKGEPFEDTRSLDGTSCISCCG